MAELLQASAADRRHMWEAADELVHTARRITARYGIVDPSDERQTVAYGTVHYGGHNARFPYQLWTTHLTTMVLGGIHPNFLDRAGIEEPIWLAEATHCESHWLIVGDTTIQQRYAVLTWRPKVRKHLLEKAGVAIKAQELKRVRFAEAS